MTEKDAIRRALREKRRALPAQEQESAARDAAAQLSGFLPYRKAKAVMAYIACRGELSLAPVIEEVLRQGRTLLLPRCDAPGIITARRISSLEDLVPGRYGLMEPAEDSGVFPPKEIDLLLVPGVAFDCGGGRLGQGGGYYDRFLPGTRALRVGVCHGFALLDRIPVSQHDARMDMILTPQALLACNKTTNDNGRA